MLRATWRLSSVGGWRYSPPEKAAPALALRAPEDGLEGAEELADLGGLRSRSQSVAEEPAPGDRRRLDERRGARHEHRGRDRADDVADDRRVGNVAERAVGREAARLALAVDHPDQVGHRLRVDHPHPDAHDAQRRQRQRLLSAVLVPRTDELTELPQRLARPRGARLAVGQHHDVAPLVGRPAPDGFIVRLLERLDHVGRAVRQGWPDASP